MSTYYALNVSLLGRYVPTLLMYICSSVITHGNLAALPMAKREKKKREIKAEPRREKETGSDQLWSERK